MEQKSKPEKSEKRLIDLFPHFVQKAIVDAVIAERERTMMYAANAINRFEEESIFDPEGNDSRPEYNREQMVRAAGQVNEVNNFSSTLADPAKKWLVSNLMDIEMVSMADFLDSAIAEIRLNQPVKSPAAKQEEIEATMASIAGNDHLIHSYSGDEHRHYSTANILRLLKADIVYRCVDEENTHFHLEPGKTWDDVENCAWMDDVAPVQEHDPVPITPVRPSRFDNQN